MIVCKQVSVNFGSHRILNDVSLEIEGGECVALVGPSGSGKTTLLRTLAGLETIRTGKVLVQNKVASEPSKNVVPPHKRGISMVLQDLGLWPNLSVRQHLSLGGGGSTEIEELLDLLGLQALAGRRPATLSGGEQQRVALGAALVGAPQLLILDEPFNALDLVLREQLILLIRDYVTAMGIGLLCATHDPADACALGTNRLVVIESGSIVCDSTTEDLMLESDSRDRGPTCCAWRTRIRQLRST